MHTIGALEAQETFESLLDRVESGEEILITRDGKPTARLVSSGNSIVISPERRAAALAALEKINRIAKDANVGVFDWEEWKAYRDEGRR